MTAERICRLALVMSPVTSKLCVACCLWKTVPAMFCNSYYLLRSKFDTLNLVGNIGNTGLNIFLEFNFMLFM